MIKTTLRPAFTGIAVIFGLTAQTAYAGPVTVCNPVDADNPLQFQCVLKLENGTVTGSTGGQVKISMPSMPMAHNVPPSALSRYEDTNGAYKFDLTLDMFGEWMLSYTLNGTDQKRFKQKLMFTSGKTTSSEGMTDPIDHKHHGSHGDHSDHGSHGDHN